MATAKSSRVANVQVPGETPAAQPEANQPQASSEVAKPEAVTDADVGLTATEQPANATKEPETATPAGIDVEALTAQIRADLVREIRAEMAAGKLGRTERTESAATARTPRRYADMHAHEIDPKTLTAPVLTKDGYLCPPAPDKK